MFDKKEYDKQYSKNNREKANLWARESYERNKEKQPLKKRNYFKTASGIYAHLKGRMTRANKLDLLKLSKEDFIKWYDSQEKVCFYCKRTLQEIIIDKTQSRKIIRRLSIDRVDNNKGYENSNIVLACGKCNKIKNDFFTKDEMLKIIKIFPYKF